MIALEGVTKVYETPAGRFPALHGIDLDVARGQMVAVVGKSGSGKSTLLNLIAGIDAPTSGRVSVGGAALAEIPRGRLAPWRGRTVGIVFQFFQLLPALSVLENVMLPMDFLGAVASRDRRARALSLLDRVGVKDQAAKLPSELSGGQQQRAAIARALANDPPVLLADEPTGNLDSATGAAVLSLFSELRADGKTVIVVTHERDATSSADRIVTLSDGHIS